VRRAGELVSLRGARHRRQALGAIGTSQWMMPIQNSTTTTTTMTRIQPSTPIVAPYLVPASSDPEFELRSRGSDSSHSWSRMSLGICREAKSTSLGKMTSLLPALIEENITRGCGRPGT
jgi:hypothetical protein